MAASVLASFCIVVWILSLCRHGFDFTDEGFYLNWISSPHSYRASATQFGFIYHPLYKLLDGDIALLRQANVLVIFGLAFILCLAILQTLSDVGGKIRSAPPFRMLALAFVIAVASLTFFDLWLPTPNYNSLTFTSLILTSVGALLSNRNCSKLSLSGWVVIGIGGALTFLAKPTSAALLASLLLVYVAAADKFSICGLLTSVLVAIAALIVSALAIDGSLGLFAHRMLDGMRVGSMLIPDQPLARMFRVDSFSFSREQQINFVLLLGLTFAMLLGARARGTLRIAAALAGLTLSAMSIWVSLGWARPAISYEPFQPMQFWAILAAVGLSVLLSPWRSYERLSRNSLAHATFFIVLPYVYAFGTNNNYWQQGARAGFFWLLAGVILSIAVAPTGAAWRRLISVVTAAILVSTGVLLATTESPYRQTQPLRLQTTIAEMGAQNATLFLDKVAAGYVRELRTIANSNGLMEGSPMIDLSGVSPGALYAVGARALGAAWLLAGYPGSNDLFKAALDGTGCETLVASWVLTEPDAPNAHSFDLLRRYGIDSSRDYREVGLVRSTRAFTPRSFEQRLLKPVRSRETAREACEQTKKRMAQ